MQINQDKSKQELGGIRPEKTKAVPKTTIDFNSIAGLRDAFPSLSENFLTYSIGQVPPRHRIEWLRAVAGELSPRQAIKANCKHCQGYEEVVTRIANCPHWKCAVRPFRPYQDKDKA